MLWLNVIKKKKLADRGMMCAITGMSLYVTGGCTEMVDRAT